jgi:hypothetical protein
VLYLRRYFIEFVQQFIQQFVLKFGFGRHGADGGAGEPVEPGPVLATGGGE